jgi:hypothetical protein
MTPIIYTPYLPFQWDGMACRWFILLKRGHERLIPHEEVHIRQQKEYGYLTYLWRYATKSQFRYNVELEAYLSHLAPDQAEIMANRYKTL